MKKMLAILVCKLAAFAARLIGRGTSKPGELALKIDPAILGKIAFKGKIIAITGSNGKTTTTEMLVRILQQAGHSVIHTEQSNQTAGIATSILRGATLGGKVKADFVVLESEERHSKNTYKTFRPDFFVVTNLLRDQLTRNGHSEFVAACLAEAIHPNMHLILNADDPIVAHLSKLGSSVTWFGVSDQAATDTVKGRYDDGAYCPHCLSKMEYKYRIFGHYGKYACTSCDFFRQQPKFEVTDFDRSTGEIRINKDYGVTLSFVSIMTAYNALAAFATAVELGIDPHVAAEALNGYNLSAGRVSDFKINGVEGILLVSKHENSTSYNLSLDYIAKSDAPCCVVFILEDVSRKYFTADTSWLWDIDFERLNVPCVKQVILAGASCDALAQRFEYLTLDSATLIVEPDTTKIGDHVDGELVQRVFCPTGFSDKGKIVGA